ncbi:D-aminoacyl-tRNA deacylase [Culicoidibacter larvae]|uniref:D-aminoacyl-tRNA deacylase n=1 Tax=Culicoidibacter larvae TaxID=2579976 RepID=A0A5R8QEX6_9FIRM|nr:D-aminoacyl-tRNA deacylase [Culicoidibacter larvae]TLG74337.1 D-tyrosyl-tRNA(Tyr) deacylase [Culicoidibacter larvae]
MRVVIQRVKCASVTIDNQIHGEIDNGFVLLVGITETDTFDVVEKVANKIAGLRVFDDGDGKMNLNIHQISGKILSISQFTLYGDCKKGNRPSFTKAAHPDIAKPLYEHLNAVLVNHEIPVATGIFGAEMAIDLINDGPVTIILDSEQL